jgi:hypothetical protein
MPVGPLYVRIVAAPSVPGGKAIALCAEDGEMVGSQIGCTVDNEVDALATITVRFHIDGKTILFASNDD